MSCTFVPATVLESTDGDPNRHLRDQCRDSASVEARVTEREHSSVECCQGVPCPEELVATPTMGALRGLPPMEP